MRTQFSTFSVIAHTANTLTVRMNSGTEYTLLRGLDQNYRRLFKLQLGKDFFRTPRKSGEYARSESSNQLVKVELTCYNLGSLTKAGW